MAEKKQNKNKSNKKIEDLQAQIKKQQEIIDKQQIRIVELKESLEGCHRFHEREFRKQERIADFYRDQAKPLRDYLSKFFDQLDEQIYQLKLKKDDLSFCQTAKSFITELEWLIIMVRKVL